MSYLCVLFFKKIRKTISYSNYRLEHLLQYLRIEIASRQWLEVKQPRDLRAGDAAPDRIQSDRPADSMRWYRQGI